MNNDMITYVAARMYLQYCRKQGHHKQLSDDIIIEKFTSNWRNFFVSSVGRRAWIDRAAEALCACGDWMAKYDDQI